METTKISFRPAGISCPHPTPHCLSAVATAMVSGALVNCQGYERGLLRGRTLYLIGRPRDQYKRGCGRTSGGLRGTQSYTASSREAIVGQSCCNMDPPTHARVRACTRVCAHTHTHPSVSE